MIDGIFLKLIPTDEDPGYEWVEVSPDQAYNYAGVPHEDVFIVEAAYDGMPVATIHAGRAEGAMWMQETALRELMSALDCCQRFTRL
jgi:hypothetical protein